MIEVTLPILHADQVRAYRKRTRFYAIRAGRRWGKSLLLQVIASDVALNGGFVMYAAPDYKRMSEFYRDVATLLEPVTASASQHTGVIRLITGGKIEFWTLNDESAGRSRRYHMVLIDEGAFTKNSVMLGIWEKAIKPTLFDYSGSCIVASNTNGVDSENFLYQICRESRFNFTEFHAPTHNNPLLPTRLPGETTEVWQDRRNEELAKLQSDNHPLVYQQEYLAEFVDWSGVAFFSRDKLLTNGEPVAYPKQCDAVLVVLDTATKTGKENDGTGVVYAAYTRHPRFGDAQLVLLDWELQQIEGSLIESYMPLIFKRGEALAAECGARLGFVGAWIEDKSSGMVLLQQAARRGWPARAIDSKLTSVGKSERAISASPYVYQDKVKISRPAYDKTVMYKGTTRNHLLSQVTGFRIGVKDQIDDDLLDSFCYTVSLTLGNVEGF